MQHPIERWLTRTRYAASQGARLAWYGMQEATARRMLARLNKDAGDARPQIPKPAGAVPDQRRILTDITGLLLRDLGNVERGLYPVPNDEPGGLADLLDRSRRYFADLPDVHRRQVAGSHQEVFTPDRKGQLPRYYLQNFHFQTDGWLSEDSAELYDTQVEILFRGAAAAMRRQALVPLAELVRSNDQRALVYADIACGSGGFLNDVCRAFPRLNKIGVDLSGPYLTAARRRLRKASHLSFVSANAEQLPLATGSLDAASVIYLFHELPAKIRRVVAAEMSRVLKDGATLVFVDSLQRGDRPDYDGLLETFPHLFHEPYYAHYLDDDLVDVFADAGLVVERQWTAFLSKVVVFRKPCGRTGGETLQ